MRPALAQERVGAQVISARYGRCCRCTLYRPALLLVRLVARVAHDYSFARVAKALVHFCARVPSHSAVAPVAFVWHGEEKSARAKSILRTIVALVVAPVVVLVALVAGGGAGHGVLVARAVAARGHAFHGRHLARLATNTGALA